MNYSNWYKKSQIQTEQIEETKTTPSNDWIKQEETDYKDPLSKKTREFLNFLLNNYRGKIFSWQNILDENGKFRGGTASLLLKSLVNKGYLKQINDPFLNRERNTYFSLTDKGLLD